jgi:hypothetical protein
MNILKYTTKVKNSEFVLGIIWIFHAAEIKYDLRKTGFSKEEKHQCLYDC